MLFVRVLTAFAKPVLVGTSVLSAATGGYLLYNAVRPDGLTSFEHVQRAGSRLILSEFGEDADAIVAIDPNDVSDRTTIATVDHAPGWGIFATLSPDGGAIAYTALPADAREPSPDAPAIAGVIEVDGDLLTLATDIDLMIPPVWSPDGTAIVVRKSIAEENSSGTQELLLLGTDGTRESITTWAGASAFPVGFSPDGAALYFATLSATGSDFYRIGIDGSGETLVAHLGDDISREWTLSPDGRTLAYSLAETGAQPRIVAMRLDLATGAAERVVAGATGSQINPAWTAANELTVASVKPEGGGDAVAFAADGSARTLDDNDDTIDLPLAWSPDGASLAVRAIDGATPLDARGSRIELWQRDGTRDVVSEGPDVLIVGWTP
jgi:Tol biopolymer transport system component